VTRAYLSIGDVLSLLRAEFPDVTISKIRFLESQGLVNPERSPSGYRKFYDEDVERLRWVLRQQREHFLPLKVIRDRLANERTSDGISDAEAADLPGTETTDLAEPEKTDLSGTEKTDLSGTEKTDEDAAVETPHHSVANLDGHSVKPHELHQADPVESSVVGLTPDRPLVAAAVGPGHQRTSLQAERPRPAIFRGAASGGRGIAGLPPAARGRIEGSGGLTPSGGGFVAPTAVSAGQSGGGKEPAVQPAAVPVAGAVEPRGFPVAGAVEPGGVPVAGAVEPAAASRAQMAEGAYMAVGGSGGGDPSAAESGAHGAARSSPDPGPGTPAPLPRVAALSGASFTLEELSAASGMAVADVAALEGFGLIESLSVAGVVYYDEEALVVAKLAAEFGAYGIEPRHLRLYRNAVEREMGLIEQIITPLLRQRNPEARQRAMDASADLARLGHGLRSSLLRRELQRQLGR